MITISNILTPLYYVIWHNFLGIWGSISYWLYLLSYNAMKIKNPQWFINNLMPRNYVKGVEKMHLLVSYINSSVHASILGGVVSLYLLDMVSYIWLENVFRFSIGYLLADIIYLFDDTINYDLSIVYTMLMIIHHILTINYENIIFIIDDNLVVLARYILARFFLAELALIPLNYSWYLINTKQEKTLKFTFASSFTVISYFVFRVINFTELFYQLYMLEHYFYLFIGLPIGIMNYYWFYKLIMKQF